MKSPHPTENNIVSIRRKKGKLFGSPAKPDEASIIVIPVPWEVTVSSRSGTALGPEIILKTSHQVNTFNPTFPNTEMNVAMLPIPNEWKMLSDQLRSATASYIHALDMGIRKQTLGKNVIAKVNQYTQELKEQIKEKSLKYLNKGKMVALLGGDHSTPLGLIEALASLHKDGYGILQIDAHANLKSNYEGFTQSHASIMYNALKLSSVKKIVQVGIRDLDKEEYETILKEKERIKCFTNDILREKQYAGEPWHKTCSNIIDTLPEKVFVSFDIDGLDPKLCPGTGSPVPGGLESDQINCLLSTLVSHGKKIIGCSLCEVSPGENLEWDALVGGYMLRNLIMALETSQQKIPK